MIRNNEQSRISFHFTYTFTTGTVKEFLLQLDSQTLNLVRPEKGSYPEWTALQFFQCPNCCLNPNQDRYCPSAISLIEIIRAFKDSVSYEEVDVTISTEARDYIKRTTLQKGLSSLLGLCMATSGCPTMQKFKPMARYHLPFATSEETMYRVLSMHLLAQYFLSKRGKTPDWDLKKLVHMYEEVKILNKAFSGRLSNISTKDASLNALAILDWFAESVTFSLNREILDEIEELFTAYFIDQGGEDEKDSNH
jgi:hypothetical protein